METFPAFFPLKGARVVIAGDGPPAEAKARLFDGSPAVVVRLSDEAAVDPVRYEGATLIFVASYDESTARVAAAAARSSGAPLNVVDRPDLSDFHMPAIIDRGAVVAAIGTAGAAPLLASLLRAEIETRIPAGAGRIAALLGERRAAMRTAFPDLGQRRAFLRSVLGGPVAEASQAGNMALAVERLDASIAAGWAAGGRVSIIVSPEVDDLLSLRAVRALNIADVIANNATASALLASHARRDAEYLEADRADTTRLAALARLGRQVVVIVSRLEPALVTGLRDTGVALEILAPAPPT
jgi:precorrin-2 dehydrogenase / sirohydrochlorin ferrochelatase